MQSNHALQYAKRKCLKKKTCIVCITIDSVINIDKKNYPHVYFEKCKYRVKKIQMSRFINTELKSDSWIAISHFSFFIAHSYSHSHLSFLILISDF